MYLDENKKVLFVTEMDQKLEQLLQQVTNIHPKNMLILNNCGPVISHPYSDVMRDIIIAVYHENIEEIFIVGTTESQEDTVDKQNLLNKIYKSERVNKEIQTLDYLFQNCMPEFPNVNVSDWLEGSETVARGIQKSVNIIRHHPLIPSHVKVHSLVMNREKGSLVEVDVS
ncbi:carbonic anhydrase [Bacillus sp. S13(2024)]|uniref:carbonic anhydrase n=1 Tax=unclassified Bacillus (in: firmicutes) TaxID=185979 RepID=UPI003D25FE21